MKRYGGTLKIKSTYSFNRCEVVDALWNYVAINGSIVHWLRGFPCA